MLSIGGHLVADVAVKAEDVFVAQLLNTHDATAYDRERSQLSAPYEHSQPVAQRLANKKGPPGGGLTRTDRAGLQALASADA